MALRRVLPGWAAGVTLLVETNGVYADTARLAALLTRARSDRVGALWDVHHPYRYAGETPGQTVTNLARTSAVHIKTVMEDGRARYRLMGEGDLPMTR